MRGKLGELAVVVSRCNNCMLQIYNNEVVVHTGEGNERKTFICNISDNETIARVITFLNSGTKNTNIS